MSGSEAEPVAPDQPPPVVAPEAAAQMQEATERLRDKAWMVAPMTNGAAIAASKDVTAEVDS